MPSISSLTYSADHRDGHRRVRNLAVLGLYLPGVAGEVGDGDLAGDDVLHRVRAPERVLDEREVYV